MENKLLKISSVLLSLLIWQLCSMLIHTDILLVSPLAVLCRLFTIWKTEGFTASIFFSLGNIAFGFFGGLIIGILLAILSDRFAACEILLRPYMVTIRSVPVASIIVICLVWLSAKHLSGLISFLIVLPIIYQNVLSGLKARNRELEDVALSNGASYFQRVRFVYLPQLAPYLMSACSVTCGMAWKAGIAAEVIASPTGSIGHRLYLAKIYIDTDDLFAWTLIIVLLSILFEKVVLLLIRLFFEKFCNASTEEANEHSRL